MTDLPPEDAPPFSDTYLDRYLDPEPTEPMLSEARFVDQAFEQLRRFEPTDDVQAEKVMRRLVAAHRRRREVLDQYEELVDPIKRWRDERLGRWDRRIAWLADHLKLYAVKRRVKLGEKDPEAATLKLPSGTVGTRRANPRVDVWDEAEFVAWAEATRHGDLLRWPDPPPPSPIKAEIKKAVQIVEKDGSLLPVLDGEVVPGLIVFDGSIEPQEPKPDLSA